MSMSEVLGELVSVVLCTGFPVDIEVSLEYAITNPILSHVNSFTSLLFYEIIRDASGAFVICLERCRWLRVAGVAEDGLYRFRFLCIVKEDTRFSFNSEGENIFHDGGKNKYDSFDLGGMGSQAQVRLLYSLARK